MGLRFATADDLVFLKWMLYEASYTDHDTRPPYDRGLREPRIAAYLEGYPRKGDGGLIATNDNNQPLGAAWYRTFPKDAPGYGFVDEHTPEIAIALRPEVRGQGLGTQLLTALKTLAHRQGFAQLSLAVEHHNTGARRLYERLGFEEVDRDDEVTVMVAQLGDGS